MSAYKFIPFGHVITCHVIIYICSWQDCINCTTSCTCQYHSSIGSVLMEEWVQNQLKFQKFDSHAVCFLQVIHEMPVNYFGSLSREQLHPSQHNLMITISRLIPLALREHTCQLSLQSKLAWLRQDRWAFPSVPTLARLQSRQSHATLSNALQWISECGLKTFST